MDASIHGPPVSSGSSSLCPYSCSRALLAKKGGAQKRLRDRDRTQSAQNLAAMGQSLCQLDSQSVE